MMSLSVIAQLDWAIQFRYYRDKIEPSPLFETDASPANKVISNITDANNVIEAIWM